VFESKSAKKMQKNKSFELSLSLSVGSKQALKHMLPTRDMHGDPSNLAKGETGNKYFNQYA
jgi:hypothetical protein